MTPVFTPEEMRDLRAPFPLDKHIVREGHKEGGKIRWFVYIDRSAVQDRLDEMFPGEWETTEPKMYPVETRTIKDDGSIETSHEMSATMGITIRGLTRWDGGESDDGSTKSAITNAFRRTAAYGWGIARYMYDMDIRIKTESYSSKGADGKWQTDWKKYDQVKQQAMDQFTQWYNRVFNVSRLGSQNGAQSDGNGEKTAADKVLGNGHNQPRNLVQNATDPLPDRNQGNSGGIWIYDLPSLMAHPDLNKMYPQYTHRGNAIKKLYEGGFFANVSDLSAAVKIVLSRPDKQEAVS